MIVVTLFSSSLVLTETSFAGSDSVFFEKGGVFLDGYDPVSYITENQAIEGTPNWTLVHRGATIHFSSKENLGLFKTQPEKYWPAYNGWCAYAMEQEGKIYSSNPEAFKVVNGRTFLFYKRGFVNTLKKWNKKNDEPNLIQRADGFWKTKHKDKHL